MKKLGLLFLLVFAAVTLTACNSAKDVTYTVSFNSDGGSTVESQVVSDGEMAVKPSTPTKDGYSFEYWYEDDNSVEFDFSTPITADVSLTALWQEEVAELTDTDRINADIAAYESDMFASDYLLNLPRDGATYASDITWNVESEYISDEGIILNVPLSDETTTSGTVTGTFTLNETTVTQSFQIPLVHAPEVEITTVRNLPFENLTTEYDVPDGNINMYYEDNGAVPYVKVTDFFDLLQGFIDPAVNFTIDTTDGVLTISYQYYDEEFDETYDLVLTVDSTENTIVTNDPGFYWAYVYTTETNYGRNILYDTNNPNASFDEGHDVEYDLDDYGMDITMYDGSVLVPYYVANQLFAGLSYFNVYYNYDSLYGIYSLPDSGTREYRTIKSSSMSNKDIPADLLVHTFNMLAFDLDNLYGLKDIMNVDTYYNLLLDNKDNLLVQDPEDFDYAIRDILLKDIDEPHTSYGYPSYFNKVTWAGPEVNDLKYYGSRFRTWYYDGLFAVDDEIAAKWGITTSGWAASSDKRPAYWFLDDAKTSVMLSLDDFYTADIDETASFDMSVVEKILNVTDGTAVLPTISEGNRFFFYNQSDDTINKMEILVKGVSASYVDTYKSDLVSLGYTLVQETTDNSDKQNGYYSISVPLQDSTETLDFMVQVTYDETYGLFYVGIADSVPDTYESSWPLIINIESTIESDSAVYMEMQLDLITAEAPNLQNITLDLSWNTGGNVGALYRIVGFITDQPFRVSGIDRDTGGNSSYYVDIENIHAYTNLNWSLLITPVTFSAANEMATIFKENDLGPIIGVQSGGGACSITPILLPNGTAFTMSSNNINAYRTGTGTTEDPYVFHNNEFGITPDFPIDISKIYDAQTLLDIIQNN